MLMTSIPSSHNAYDIKFPSTFYFVHMKAGECLNFISSTPRALSTRGWQRTSQTVDSGMSLSVCRRRSKSPRRVMHIEEARHLGG